MSVILYPTIIHTNEPMFEVTGVGVSFSEVKQYIADNGYLFTSVQIVASSVAQIQQIFYYTYRDANGNSYRRPFVPMILPSQTTASFLLTMDNGTMEQGALLKDANLLQYDVLGGQSLTLTLMAELNGIEFTLIVRNFSEQTQTLNISGLPPESDNSNATTEYRYDITDYDFTQNVVSVIATRNVTGSAPITYSQGVVEDTLDSLLASLNAMQLGTWVSYSTGGHTYLSLYSDNYTLGEIGLFTFANPSLTYVISFNGRSGEVMPATGDYNTDQVTEGLSNLYFTTPRARAAISGGNGMAYSSSTGQMNLGAPLSRDTVLDGGSLYGFFVTNALSFSATTPDSGIAVSPAGIAFTQAGGHYGFTNIPHGTTAGNFLSWQAGELAYRTSAEVLSDIGGAPATGSPNYIQNNLSFQQTANMWISGTIRTDGDLGIGTTPAAGYAIHVRRDLDQTVGIRLENVNTGANAFAAVQIGQDITGGTKFANLGYGNSAISNYGPYFPESTFLISNGAGGISIGTVAGSVRFYSEYSFLNPAVSIDVNGYLNLASVPAQATAGSQFLTLDAAVVKYRTPAQVLSDIGAAPAGGSTAYVQNTVFQQASSNFYISGTGRAANRLVGKTVEGGFTSTVAPALVDGQISMGFTTGTGSWIYTGANTLFLAATAAATGSTVVVGGFTAPSGTEKFKVIGGGYFSSTVRIGSLPDAAGAVVTKDASGFLQSRTVANLYSDLGFPDQTSHAGQYLTTNGLNMSWAAGESPLTFTNGLTRTLNNVVLGGQFISTTQIDFNGNSFYLGIRPGATGDTSNYYFFSNGVMTFLNTDVNTTKVYMDNASVYLSSYNPSVGGTGQVSASPSAATISYSHPTATIISATVTAASTGVTLQTLNGVNLSTWTQSSSGTIQYNRWAGTGTRIVAVGSSGIVAPITNGSNGQFLNLTSGVPTWTTITPSVITWAGTTLQYVRGDGSLATFPTDNLSFTNGWGFLTSATAGVLYAPISGSANYIQNQFSAAQASSALWLSGQLRADGAATFGGNTTLSSIPALATAATLFLVSNSGVVSSRTPSQVLSDIGGQASGNYITSISLTTPNVLFATPVTFSVVSGAASGTMSLNNQAATTVLGNFTNTSAAPAFNAATADGQFLVRRSGALTFGILTAADIPSLTATYVPYTGATGPVTLGQALSATTLTATGLTTGRFTLVTTGGLLTSLANITYNANTVTFDNGGTLPQLIASSSTTGYSQITFMQVAQQKGFIGYGGATAAAAYQSSVFIQVALSGEVVRILNSASVAVATFGGTTFTGIDTTGSNRLNGTVKMGGTVTYEHGTLSTSNTGGAAAIAHTGTSPFTISSSVSNITVIGATQVTIQGFQFISGATLAFNVQSADRTNPTEIVAGTIFFNSVLDRFRVRVGGTAGGWFSMALENQNVTFGTGSFTTGSFSSTVGITGTLTAGVINMNGATNANFGLTITDSVAGNAANTIVRVVNSSGNFAQLGMYSTTTTPFGVVGSGEGYAYANKSFSIVADLVGNVIKFAAGGTTEVGRFTSTGFSVTGINTVSGGFVSTIALGSADFSMQTSGVTRWSFYRQTLTSDFAIGRYNSGGSFIDSPITIRLTDGIVATSASLVVNAAAASIGAGDRFYLNGNAAMMGNVAVTGNITATGDIEVLNTANGVIQRSADGTRWRIRIDNAGVISASAI